MGRVHCTGCVPVVNDLSWYLIKIMIHFTRKLISPKPKLPFKLYFPKQPCYSIAAFVVMHLMTWACPWSILHGVPHTWIVPWQVKITILQEKISNTPASSRTVFETLKILPCQSLRTCFATFITMPTLALLAQHYLGAFGAFN